MISSVVIYIFIQIFSVLSCFHISLQYPDGQQSQAYLQIQSTPCCLRSRPGCFFLSAWFQVQLKPQESSADFQTSFASTTPSSGKGSLHECQRHLWAPCQITQCFKVGWLPPGIFEGTTWKPCSQFCKTLLHEFSNLRHFNIHANLKSTYLSTCMSAQVEFETQTAETSHAKCRHHHVVDNTTKSALSLPGISLSQ